jgi:predicted kinase
MPKCTILVGVPGSGKSTWFEKNKTATTAPVSTDNIIEFLGGLYGFTYNEIFSETIRFADMVMVKRMIWNAEQGNDLVIDRTNMSAKARQQFIKKLSKYGYEFECVVFPTPEPEEWKRRLNRPGKTIPQEAIDRMVTSYEEPTEAEGFSKITFL